MSEERKARATITFFGEPARTPGPGSRVALRVANSFWREGSRCISASFVEDGERRVWVATEEEYATAMKEGHTPAGDTWPVSQISPSDEG